MFDFRNHGASDSAPRGIAGVGLEEYKDVSGALGYIAGREDLKDLPVGFVSFCMGANSTIIANSKEPSAFKSVKCFFLIQPISMGVFIKVYSRKLLTRPLADLLMPIVKKCIVWRGGHPLDEISPGAYVKDIKVPTKYVQARNDPWTELSDIQDFYANTTDNPREFFWIEDTKHRFESYSYFEDRPEVMLDWLKRWVKTD